MIPVSLMMGWLDSVMYVSALSLWALVSGHWPAWQAARVEVAQMEDTEKRDKEDLVAEVVAALFARTNVEPASKARQDPAGSSANVRLSGWSLRAISGGVETRAWARDRPRSSLLRRLSA